MTTTPVYGIWDPVKDDPFGDRSCMERWPSKRVAEQALRDRLAPAPLTIPACRTRYINRPEQDDAQFYGSVEQSCIYLYASPDAEKPHAIIEFGPRGGIRQQPITTAQ